MMNPTVQFLRKVMKVKETKRTGWVVQGVKDSESVADHTFGVSIIALALAKRRGLDETKIMKMALIHDVAEGLTGDMVLEKGNKKLMSAEEKNAKEDAALKSMVANMPETKELLSLWREFQDLKTPEALFVKQIDKLEMVIQALVYEEQNPKVNLDEFWINVEKYLKDEELIELFKELQSMRPKMQ